MLKYQLISLGNEGKFIWLDPDLKDTSKLKEMLMPYTSEEMEAYEISPLVLLLQKLY